VRTICAHVRTISNSGPVTDRRPIRPDGARAGGAPRWRILGSSSHRCSPMLRGGISTFCLICRSPLQPRGHEPQVPIAATSSHGGAFRSFTEGKFVDRKTSCPKRPPCVAASLAKLEARKIRQRRKAGLEPLAKGAGSVTSPVAQDVVVICDLFDSMHVSSVAGARFRN